MEQSEAVACPYCVEPDFGVFYRPPLPIYRRDPSGSALVCQLRVPYTEAEISTGCKGDEGAWLSFLDLIHTRLSGIFSEWQRATSKVHVSDRSVSCLITALSALLTLSCSARSCDHRPHLSKLARKGRSCKSYCSAASEQAHHLPSSWRSIDTSRCNQLEGPGGISRRSGHKPRGCPRR